MKTRIIMVFVSLVILLPASVLAQDGWITLPCHALIARSSNNQWYTAVSHGIQSYLYPMGSGSPSFVAPVVFPPEANGLSVRQMNATVGDFDAGTMVGVYLYRTNRFSGISNCSQTLYNFGDKQIKWRE